MGKDEEKTRVSDTTEKRMGKDEIMGKDEKSQVPDIKEVRMGKNDEKTQVLL